MKKYPAIKERKIKDLDNGTKACGLPERLGSLWKGLQLIPLGTVNIPGKTAKYNGCISVNESATGCDTATDTATRKHT